MRIRELQQFVDTLAADLDPDRRVVFAVVEDRDNGVHAVHYRHEVEVSDQLCDVDAVLLKLTVF